MNNNLQPTATYSSLLELQLRKEQIRNAIHKDNSDIVTKWRSLFTQPKTNQKKGFTMATLINTGTGLFDGFMLAWKLYKKFRR